MVPSRHHSEYHDCSFSARRVLTRADERFAGLLQWTPEQIDEVNENDVLEYRRTTVSSTDMDWLNSELYALLAITTADTVMADYTWQKARQQADVFVRDVSLTTETCHHSITCEHEHEQSHCHEGHSSGPNGCITDELERLET